MSVDHLAPPLTRLYSFAAGEFWDEEAFYLEQRLAVLVGETESKRIMSEEIKEETHEGTQHPFHIMCNPSYLPIIKQAYTLPINP